MGDWDSKPPESYSADIAEADLILGRLNGGQARTVEYKKGWCELAHSDVLDSESRIHT
jgi:hypothetical protein